MNLINIFNDLKQNHPIFSSELLMTRYKLEAFQVKDLILELKKQNKIQFIYRLKSEERFKYFDNDWTPHLQDLCKVYITNSGNFIDGSEISNIDFKFKILDSSLM